LLCQKSIFLSRTLPFRPLFKLPPCFPFIYSLVGIPFQRLIYRPIFTFVWAWIFFLNCFPVPPCKGQFSSVASLFEVGTRSKLLLCCHLVSFGTKAFLPTQNNSSGEISVQEPPPPSCFLLFCNISLFFIRFFFFLQLGILFASHHLPEFV